MADSGTQTPLLRRPSRQGSSKRGRGSCRELVHPGSNACLTDKYVYYFRTIFTLHNVATASGPLATLALFAITQIHGFGEEAAELAGVENKIGPMLGALLWMALWWIMEPVPIAITALLPLAIFPFFEIMEANDVAREYTNDIITLLLGTFILALAIEKYNLHKRMALKILLVAGGEIMEPRLLLAGFLVGPTIVSMWMSNTTAAAMMIPMATGVIKNFKPEHHHHRKAAQASASASDVTAEEGLGGEKNEDDSSDYESDEDDVDPEEAIKQYAKGIMLAVTYGVAIGGMGTLIGSGPNLVLPGIYSQLFPDAPQISFMDWMKFAACLTVPWIVLLWVFLCWRYSPSRVVPVLEASLSRSLVQKDYESLGPITFPEVFISIEFCILIVLWVTRSFGETPGWAQVFDDFPDDGAVAVAGAVLLFMVPNFQKEGEMIMDWKACKNISWNVILVLGGGFALSKGIQASGLSTWIGMKMEVFEYVPYLLLTPVLGMMLSIITEFASNAAVATLFLPILAQVAVKTLNVHPLLLMLPATFACQYAFVLPSGTPPNAIAFGTGFIAINDMGLPGLFMHVVGIIILSIVTVTVGVYMFGIDQPASSLAWIS